MDKRKRRSRKKTEEHTIIKLSDYRKNKNEERRREYERVLFNRILGVYSFAEKEGIHHIDVVDVSYSGMKFREESPSSHPNIGDKMALRFYFTPSSFLRLILEIKRVNPYKEDGQEGLEYGASFDNKTKSYKVIRQLVSFMNGYSDVAVHDTDPPMIFF